MSIRTIKLPIQFQNEQEKDEVRALIANYNCVLRFTYNRVKEQADLTTKEITALQQKMEHVCLDSHFKNSARIEALALKDKPKVVFGGKKLFTDRCQGRISREEFLERRLVPLCSIGESPQKANRKFRIQDESHILFQPDRLHHYILTLPKLRKNYKRDLLRLLEMQELKTCPITYKLSLTHIEISFEHGRLGRNEYPKVKGRVFSVDLNPNYIGWTVVDWTDSDHYKLVASGVVSNKGFTDKENSLHCASSGKEQLDLSHKRIFENADTVIYLINTARHYQCELFAIESLDIKPSDKKKGSRFNRLVNNQWDRKRLYTLFEKHCGANQIRFIPVMPQYSSFEGNLIFRHLGLPDMCLASVEIGRRAFEYFHQYVLKDRPVEKNIIFHESKQSFDQARQSLEELSYEVEFQTLFELYIKLKTLDLRYRVPLDVFKTVFSKKSIKSGVLLYSA